MHNYSFISLIILVVIGHELTLVVILYILLIFSS